MPTARKKVFISYSRKNKKWLERLQTHLRLLEREGLVEVWDDTRISPGSQWDTEIRRALDSAKVAVLLVSADFLGSSYIADTELPALLTAAKRDGVLILPVIVSASGFEETKLGQFLSVNDPARPLVDLSEGEQETIFYKVCEAIRAALKPKQTGTIERKTVPALRHYSATKSSHTNPFDAWTPAVPPRFVGRTSLLRDLGNALEDKRSVSVVGDWRIGKTSLLATWAEQVRSRGREIRCVSGEGPEGASIGAFVKAITGLDTADGADEAADGLDSWVEALGLEGLPPVFLVDEADRLFVRFDRRFFERIRGMVTKSRICLVLASRREIDQVYLEQGRTSPLLDLLQFVRMGLLASDEAEALIDQGAPCFDAGGAELLRHWSGRHPFYLQLLGHHLVRACQTGEDKTSALDRFYDEARVRLRELWRVLDEREQQALRDGVTGPPIRHKLLERRGLVTNDGKLFGEILAQWLREEAP